MLQFQICRILKPVPTEAWAPKAGKGKGLGLPPAQKSPSFPSPAPTSHSNPASLDLPPGQKTPSFPSPAPSELSVASTPEKSAALDSYKPDNHVMPPEEPADLSPGAIYKRCWRMFKARADGSFLVPEEVVNEWRNLGTRANVEREFDKCGWDPATWPISLRLLVA